MAKKPRKRGRCRLPAEQRHDQRTEIGWTPAEKTELDATADAEGLAATTLLRRAWRYWLNLRLQAVGQVAEGAAAEHGQHAKRDRSDREQ